ncbi:MAG: hypothetical protein ACYC3I_27505 [Gemmataceae bacterium]
MEDDDGCTGPPHSANALARAVRLVKTHGLSRTAAALGRDYYRLKKRAEETADQSQSISPVFVELPSPIRGGKQGLFELDNGAGAWMRVQLMGYDAADVVALLGNFWSADSCYRSRRR